MIRTKRAYDAIEPVDGTRFLVDHIWPRGLKKESLQIASWEKEIAPSDKLRKWFGHDPAKWDEFQRRYSAELDQNAGKLQTIIQAAKKNDITLVFGARDVEHNNAIALKRYLEAL